MHKIADPNWMRNHQQQLEVIYNHAGIGIAMFSPQGHFLKVNPKLCEMLGYQEAELLTKTFFDITAPEDFHKSWQWTVNLIEPHSEMVVGEKRYVHKLGHSIWVKILSTPVHEDGRPVYFVTAIEDVTDQKNAEDLLRHQKEIFELMARNIPLNTTLERIVKLIEEQAPGAHSAIYLVQDGKLMMGAAPSFPEPFIEAVKNGAPIGPEAGICGAAAYFGKRIVSTDIDADPWWGEYRNWVKSYGYLSAWSTPLIDINGKVVATVNMCWKEKRAPTQRHFELADVATHLMSIAIGREKMDNLLREQQMRMVTSSKLAALGEMAGGLAHEINNPLAIINVRAEQLRNAVEKNKLTPTLAAEITESIQNTSERISKIVRGLRAFARDGDHEPIQETLIEKAIEDTLAFCRERFRSQGVDLSLQMNPGIKLRCRAVQISQVILNLLNNSYDAVEGQAEKWVKVVVEETESSVMISVTDNGPGIPEKIRHRIIEPFFTTKHYSKGTGLGLSISSSIVASHHGTLVLDTNSPHTRFVVTLPKNFNPEK